MLGSRFSLIEELKPANQARRYRAQQDDSQVLLKVFAAEVTDEPSALLGFLLTAHAAAKLSHSNIAVTQKPEQLQGIHFYISDYPQNAEPLRSRLQRQGWLEVEQVLDIASQITDALHHAHQSEVLHLNLQPENLWLDAEGNITVTDFGVPVNPVRPWLYEKRARECPLAYRSPELLNHQTPDERSDLYSLGILLYELLTDMLPFAARNEEELRVKIMLQKAPAAQLIRPDIPEALSSLIARLIAENPAARFANAAALRVELAALRDGNLFEINLLPEASLAAPVNDDLEEHQPLASLFEEDQEFLTYDFNHDSAASPFYFKTTEVEPYVTDEHHTDEGTTGDSLSSALALPMGVDSSVASFVDSSAPHTAGFDETPSRSANATPQEALSADDEPPMQADVAEAASGQSWLSFALLALGVAILTAFLVLAYKGYFNPASETSSLPAGTETPYLESAASSPVNLPIQNNEDAASTDATTSGNNAQPASEASVPALPSPKPDTSKLREQLRQNNLAQAKKQKIRKSQTKARASKAKPRRGFFRWRFW